MADPDSLAEALAEAIGLPEGVTLSLGPGADALRVGQEGLAALDAAVCRAVLGDGPPPEPCPDSGRALSTFLSVAERPCR